MKKYILIAVALFFVIVAGVGDGAQTAKRDLGLDTPMYAHFVSTGDTLAQAWYRGDGGNHRWNPSFPTIPWVYWSADWWHTMKFVWIYAYALAIATLACGYFDTRKAKVIAFILVFLFAEGIEGQCFRVFYGNVCRNSPKSSIIDILSDINPLKNTH